MADNGNNILAVFACPVLDYTGMPKPVKEKHDSMTIHDLPVADRPRERLQRLGVEALSAQEILAVILGRGIAGESVMVTAQRLLSQFGGLKGIAAASLEELSQIRGIGLAKASQIKAAVELARRTEGYSESTGNPTVKTPEDVFNLAQGRLQGKKKEYFLAALLDTRAHLIKLAEISIGSLDGSIVHPREVFKEAISATASSVIFIHNHPSGDTEASEDDIRVTKRLAEVGEIVGITVLDHVIIGGKSYTSLKREGLF
jgi:DNA repair protein RadC